MKQKIKYSSIILLILPLSIFQFNSCTLFQIDKPETEELLPRETEVLSWRLKAAPADYDNSNISEYIQNSEQLKLFKVYGFQELSTANFISFSIPQKEVLVEVFQMDSSLNAFGILSIERPAEIKKSDVCNESYSTPNGLFAWTNNYYIRVRSSNQYKNPHPDLKIFLKII